MTDKEIKIILEKQLQLLSEYASAAHLPEDVIAITNAIISVTTFLLTQNTGRRNRRSQ